jgi:predicted methyltransferase
MSSTPFARADHRGTRRRTLLAWAAAPALVALPARSQPSADARLQQVIAGAHRSAANRQRDAARHPSDTLRFFGLKPGHAVIEIAPGGGWYTEILAPWLHDHGQLLAAHYATDDPSEGRRRSRARFEAKLAAAPDLYGRVKVGTLPSGPSFTDLSVPGGADAVLTFRNVHNWLETDQLDTMLSAFHGALRAGGLLGVVDHRARPGTSLAQIKATGYVTEDVMIERARAAGFGLQARSEINANPADTQDHPNGVWSLPPTLRGGDVDRARFLAIGESDRFTHRYVKL